jgi:uncharacterized protein (TIGR03083 family)
MMGAMAETSVGAAGAASVDHLAACAGAAAAVVAAIRSCSMNARVPACPDWTAYDVVVHLGNTHGWAATIVETGERAPAQHDAPTSRRAAAVARWYAAKAEDLLQVLRAACPEDPCWTFSEVHRTRGFWSRRQAHETLVHLTDLLQAADRGPRAPELLTGSLAADGVAEVLEVFLPRMHARGRRADIAAEVLLAATDTGDRWLVEPAATDVDPPSVRRLAQKGPAGYEVDTISAPAADLMLLLWKRLPADGATIHLDGERDRLLAFLASPLTP